MITEKISPWIARLILLIMTPIGAGTIWLTRKYGHESLEALALSVSAKLVRQVSIDVLLSAHIGLVLVIALLPGKKFRAWRVALALLAFGIWGFDGVGMYAARYGIMDKANTTLESAADRYKTKKQLIEDLQASAKERRAQATKEWNNTRFSDAIKSRDMASKESAEATRLQKELDLMPDGAGTSEVRTFGGQENAMWRAIAEAALVSLVLVAAFALIGLMLREVLHSDAPVAVKPDAPAKPALSLFTRLGRWCGILVSGGTAALAPVHAAPVESSQPAAPSIPSNSTELKNAPSAPACTPADADALMSAPVAPAKPASAPDAPAPKPAPIKPATLAPDTPAQVQEVQSAKSDAPGKVQVQSVRRKLPDGVREAVRSRLVKPTQAGLKSMGVGQGYAAEWLAQMGTEGILESNGKGGWILKGVKP